MSEHVRGEEGEHAGVMEADAEVALGGPPTRVVARGGELVEGAL